MTTESRKIQLEAGVNTTEAKAGFNDLKTAAKDMGAGVTQAGQQAAKSLDTLGNSGTGAAEKLGRAEKQLIASIQRQAAVLEAGSKSGSAYYEVLAKQRGVDVNVLRPYLDQLDLLQKKQAAAGVSVAQTTAAFRQLPAQMTDIATQLAGGQSPFLILLQQGGQIKDSFGGIGPTFKALSGYITPITLGIGALGAAVAGFATAAIQAETLDRSLNSLRAQLEGTGRAGLASRADLKALIDELARAPETTKEGATQVVSELTKVHGIGTTLFRDLAGAAADYAKATGTDLPTAARTLAQAFADPAKGAKTLDDALGTLTSTQLLTIEKLAQQNDLVGAQRELFTALQGTIRGLADNAATPLQKALADLGNTWSDTMKSLGQNVPLVSMNQLLAGSVDLIKEYIKFASDPKFAIMTKLGLDTTPPLLRSGVGRVNSPPAGTSMAAAANASRSADAAAGAQDEESIKRALRLGAAYQSAAGKAADLTDTQKSLSSALRLAEDRYGKNSEQAQKLRDQVAGVGEAIAAARKKAAGTGAADARALALLDVEKIKAANGALVDNYQNAERQLDAMRSAGLVGDAEYYQAKRSFIDLIDGAQEDALRKENARLMQQTLNTKDAADRDRKVAENNAQIARLQAKATTDGIILTLQEKSAIEARASALLAARQAAQDYFDTTNRGYARDIASQGLGGQTRGYNAAISQIEDRYQQQRTQLQNSRALAELSSPLTDEAKKQYDAQLEIINAFQAKAVGSYQSYYDTIIGMQGDWSLGAREAFANYYDSARNVAYQTQGLFTNAFQNLEDVFVRFATTGKLSFKTLADSFIADLVRMEVKAAASSLFKSFGGASGLFGAVFSAFAGNSAGLTASTASSNYNALAALDGARADGGPTAPHGLYEVAEKGRPELLSVGGRSYLLMGNQAGSVTPAAAGGGGSGTGGGNVFIENHGADVQAQKVPSSDGTGFDWRIVVNQVANELANDYSDRQGPLYHAIQGG